MEEAKESSSQLPDLSVIDLESDQEHHDTTGQELSCEADKEDGQQTPAGLENSSVYTHPVFKELSQLNKEINTLNVKQLKSRLREHKLDTSGRKDVLRKRLKTHLRCQKLKEHGEEASYVTSRNFYYDNYLVIDFEATCDDRQNQATYRHEIIEFPAHLVSTEKAKIVGHFHTYVRPLINPRLTTFCTSLTGITQDMVNFAPTFPEALNQFDEWLKGQKLSSHDSRVAVITDGPFDMGRFLHQQCSISKVPYPSWGGKWINIRKSFSNFYKTKRMPLKDMLGHLDMGFQGQPHRGLDDSRNIARVAIRLLRDGANMRVNEKINIKMAGSYNPGERVVRNINRHNFGGMKKKLLAANDKDSNCSSNDQSIQENVSDSDCDDNETWESESLWPNTGDVNEFPDLLDANRMNKI